MSSEDAPEDDSVCFYCGWPDCRCDDDDDDMCEHGIPFDEYCEECEGDE